MPKEPDLYTLIINQLIVHPEGLTHTQLLENIQLSEKGEIEEFWEALAEMIEHDAISEENEGPCPTYYL